MNKAAWVVATLAVASFMSARSAAQGKATIEKPKSRTVTTGTCRILSDGTLSGSFGPGALPTLGFTIGPHATMADAMHASKTEFKGPGEYKSEIVAVYLGKTALEDGYSGLGTIVFNSDGHSGTFALNDGSASGSFDCGTAPKRD